MIYRIDSKNRMRNLLVVLVLSMTVLLAACSNPVQSKGAKEAIGNQEEVYMAQSLEEYIEPYGIKLDKSKHEQLSEVYNGILDEYNNNKLSKEELNTRLMKLDIKLRKAGVPLSYYTLEEFIDGIETISKEDRDYIVSNESIILPEEGTDISEEKANEVIDKTTDILNKYGISLNEVLEQIYNENYIFAVYNIDKNGSELAMDRLTSEKELSSKEKETFKDGIAQTKKILPGFVWSKINLFEFNTDGFENVLAHTVASDDNNRTFRLALDIEDIFDKNGKITEDGMKTIVHESAHIIGMLEPQVILSKISDDTITDVREMYKKNSYQYKFYEAFWVDKYDELLKIGESNGDSYEFYEKYKKEFLNDYAASSPEEDLAESFMTFVFENKPKTDTTLDKKINFFYQYKELVKLREEFRNNIGL